MENLWGEFLRDLKLRLRLRFREGKGKEERTVSGYNKMDKMDEVNKMDKMEEFKTNDGVTIKYIDTDPKNEEGKEWLILVSGCFFPFFSFLSFRLEISDLYFDI